MNNETILKPLPSREKSSRTWWVLFNKINGKISTISPRKINQGVIKNDDELIAEVNNPVCKDILKGKKNKNKYSVLWDFKNECWNLDIKSTTLVIRPNDNKLTPIDIGNPKEACDIHITFFRQDFTLLISANLKNIAETMNLADIGFISTSENKLLDLFITKRNDPDYLVHIVPVNPEELLNQQRILVKLPQEINKVIDWDNISIYTKPVFKTYGLDVYNGSGLQDSESRNKRVLHVGNFTRESSDINIYIHNEELYIDSKLTDTQMSYFGGKTKFNILVCDQEIDNLIGNLELNVSTLCGRKEYKLPIPKNWPKTPLLVHRNKKIKVSYTGD